MNLTTRRWIHALACGALALTLGCSSGSPGDPSGSGGAPAGTGGSAATGGTIGTGGRSSGSGGATPGTGGSSSGTGGGTGGTVASSGGTNGSGGAVGSGGAMGGTTGTGGGAAATGGATGGSSGGGRSGSGGSAGASAAGSGGQGGASSPAAELEGAGWTMLCGPLSGKGDNQCYLYPPGQSSCPSGGYMSVDKTLHFGGTPGTTYDVTIRFQGTHEAGDYSGGTKVDTGGKMLKGATHTSGGPHTWLAMEVSAPAATYNPNSGGGAGSVQVYDYMATIQIQGGATLHLTGHDQDCLMHRYCQNNVLNPCKGLVVDGISPADSPIDGSFLNMHVISAVAK